jgi:coenzyme F420 hydrogenase subunit beta
MQHQAPSSLSIIGQPPRALRSTPEVRSSFRGNTPWPPQESTKDQPRALRALATIIDGGLCHRCGTCIGICPTGVLGLDSEGYPEAQNLSQCTDCDLCVKVCPGDEFDFKEHHQRVFGTPGEPESTHGHFIESAVVHATDSDIQERSTSGGLVTALLLYLLERKEIDGAVVIVSDGDVLWKGKPIIARTREELLSAMKSKYAIAPTNSVFSEIREIPGRYALVGLPCQIHGFVKAAALDERLKERVVLTIGLFCHAAIEHEAFRVLWDSLGERTKGAVKFISRIGKHPGTPYLMYNDGSLYPVYFGDKRGYRPTSIEMINILYRLYTPARCLTCFDASAEFADIAVGDPWMAPPEDGVDFYKGWSFALIRSARAQALCKQMTEEKVLTTVPVTRNEALRCNTLMANEKRWRAFRVIETLRRQGRPIPEYRMESPKHTLKHFIKTELHIITHTFCFMPNIRARVLRFILSDWGYALLWCNHKRRALRFFVRDTKSLIMRKLFGRR